MFIKKGVIYSNSQYKDLYKKPKKTEPNRCVLLYQTEPNRTEGLANRHTPSLYRKRLKNTLRLIKTAQLLFKRETINQGEHLIIPDVQEPYPLHLSFFLKTNIKGWEKCKFKVKIKAENMSPECPYIINGLENLGSSRNKINRFLSNPTMSPII